MTKVELDSEVAVLLRHAVEAAEARELCGLLFRRGSAWWFVALRNYGLAGEFAVDEREMNAALNVGERENRELIGFVHSHRSSLDLSAADRRAWKASRLPWLVVRVTSEGIDCRMYAPYEPAGWTIRLATR